MGRRAGPGKPPAEQGGFRSRTPVAATAEPFSDHTRDARRVASRAARGSPTPTTSRLRPNCAVLRRRPAGRSEGALSVPRGTDDRVGRPPPGQLGERVEPAGNSAAVMLTRGALQQAGLIKRQPGHREIVDRHGLASIAGPSALNWVVSRRRRPNAFATAPPAPQPALDWLGCAPPRGRPWGRPRLGCRWGRGRLTGAVAGTSGRGTLPWQRIPRRADPGGRCDPADGPAVEWILGADRPGGRPPELTTTQTSPRSIIRRCSELRSVRPEPASGLERPPPRARDLGQRLLRRGERCPPLRACLQRGGGRRPARGRGWRGPGPGGPARPRSSGGGGSAAEVAPSHLPRSDRPVPGSRLLESGRAAPPPGHGRLAQGHTGAPQTRRPAPEGLPDRTGIGWLEPMGALG